VSQSRPQLDYAHQAPWHRRRGARRALILVAGILLGLSLWRFGPDALRRTQLFFLQRKAMAYSVPAGTIAFTINLEEAKKCLALSGNDSAYVSNKEYTAELIVGPWRDFYAKYSPPGGGSNAAFCHELTSKSGNKRLVVVTIVDHSSFVNPMIMFTPTLFVPGTLLSPPKEIALAGAGTAVFGRDTTVFMGQVDPSDASHFTIDVADGSTRDTIDGYLLDNDTVVLESRSVNSNRH
jgi:hypothetical protein